MGIHPRHSLHGPLGLLLYVLADKEPRPGEHEAFTSPLWKQDFAGSKLTSSSDQLRSTRASRLCGEIGFPLLPVIVQIGTGLAVGRRIVQKRMSELDVDVLVAGGGPAGLSAALVLGRCHRRVLLCDDAKQRNRFSHAVHGLLGYEGRSPSAFLEAARSELGRYPSIRRCGAKVTTIRRSGIVFEYECEDGTRGTAEKILLATGLVDELPEIAGIDEFYGVSVHHCLYCDGFEYKDRPVAAYGKGDKGADLAIMMKYWISDVVLCTDGSGVSAKAAKTLATHNIPVRTEPIASLEGEGGHLKQITFEQGPVLDRAALFFATGCHQGSDLSQRLGCERDEKGGVITDPATEETSVPGVYVAGDVSRDVLLVAIAVAEGAKAAVAINKAFLRSEGFCE
jgi:thioredoxin reductase